MGKMVICVIMMTGLLLSACEAVNKITPGSTQENTMAGLDGEPSDGSVNMVPPNILNIPGIPVPNGVLVSMGDTVIVGADDNWSGQVVMSSEEYQPIQLVEFMRKNMPRYGWVESAIVRSRRTSITYVNQDRFATVRIQPLDGGGSEIDIVVSPAGMANARPAGGGLSDVQNNQPQSAPTEPVIITTDLENNDGTQPVQ